MCDVAYIYSGAYANNLNCMYMSNCGDNVDYSEFI